MKLAILGADVDSLALAQWACEQGGHDLVAAFDSDVFAPELLEIAPSINLKERWEALFLSATADAVIVGCGGQEFALAENIDPAERRADQLRKLVQASVPLVVLCPACEAIVGFEIEMIRSDTKSIIIPHVPGASHPAIRELLAALRSRDGELTGPIERITLEREQADRSRDAVLKQLARDATLLRKLIGTIQTVSASGPPAAVGRDPLGPKPKELPSLAKLNVHFGGNTALTAQWSVTPTVDGDQGILTVVCERVKAVLTMPANGDWVARYTGEMTNVESYSGLLDAEQTFARLERATSSNGREDVSAWLSTCRDQEAAEAVDRSLVRGRTIELFNESHTEEQSFKGVMAAGGCLLLLGALGILFFIVLIESLQLPARILPEKLLFVWRLWPVYLLVPIVIFLFLQFLQLAVKREPKAGS
jgi:hypothetical protein